MSVRIVRKTVTDEYVVKVWIDGKRREEQDYFTNNRKDAKATAEDMLKRYNASHK